MIRWSWSLSIRLTRIGSSSSASTTGRSFPARAAQISSPFWRQLPRSIPARSFTRTSPAESVSTRSSSPCRKLAKLTLMRSHAPRASRDAAPISTMASAAVATSSRSTKTVSKCPSARRRRSSSRTRLVLPIRRCAVSNVWVPSRTRALSTSSSRSRSKKRSPSTQFDPAFFSPAMWLPRILLSAIMLASSSVGKCLAGRAFAMPKTTPPCRSSRAASSDPATCRGREGARTVRSLHQDVGGSRSLRPAVHAVRDDHPTGAPRALPDVTPRLGRAASTSALVRMRSRSSSTSPSKRQPTRWTPATWISSSPGKRRGRALHPDDHVRATARRRNLLGPRAG